MERRERKREREECATRKEKKTRRKKARTRKSKGEKRKKKKRKQERGFQVRQKANHVHGRLRGLLNWILDNTYHASLMNNVFVGVSGRGCRARKSVDPLTKMDGAVIDYQRQTWPPTAFLTLVSLHVYLVYVH